MHKLGQKLCGCRHLLKELAEEPTTYREAGDKILNYCAPDCNLDMLKRDLLDIKQEPDDATTKFLKRLDME
uniref:Uncharacterized protein n=1 Tax=Romanomermis culicivorax TaxID=13658 RepID=A0A915IXA2_ROMCU